MKGRIPNQCLTCTYFINNECSKSYKPHICPVRTRKGIYKNLEDSNIFVNTPFGKYKFPSETTKGKFEKMLDYRLTQLRAVKGVIFKYTDKATKTFDLTNIVMLCYEKTYRESLISGNNIYTKAKR